MRKSLLLSVLFLSSCAGYQKPLCEESSLVDVANLEGRFSTTFSMVTAEKSQTVRQSIVVVRQSRGRYSAQKESGENIFSVCEIDGLTYAEGDSSWSGTAPGTYGAFLLKRNGDGSFDLGLLGVDSDLLEARAIPFKIVKLEKPKTESSMPGDAASFAIRVDNSALTASEFVQLLDPMSLKLTWLPAN